MSAEALVASVAADYDDERGTLTESALRRLAAYQAGAGKVCSACAEKHPLGAFGVDTQKTDGLATKCLASAASQRKASRARNV